MHQHAITAICACLAAAALAQHQVAHLLASDGQAEDFFGGSVAIVGDVAFIAASGDDDRGFDTGAVYVFERIRARWTEVAKILSPGPGYEEYFGLSLAFDGERAIVGEPYAVGGGGSDCYGAAHVIERVGGVWMPTAMLAAPDAEDGDRFGGSVSIDGELAVVGAGGVQDAAYVFGRIDGAWTFIEKIENPEGDEDDAFGAPVHVSGQVILVGATGDDDLADRSGAVHVFEYINGRWEHTSKLRPWGDVADDFYFGSPICVSGDTLAVGAWDGVEQPGAVFLLERDGDTWIESAKLTASDREEDDFFGDAISLDRDTLIVGAAGDDDLGSRAGAAYLFRRIGGVWTETAKLTASGGRAGDRSGDPALSGDTVVIGSLYDDDLGRDAGSAQIFYVGECNADFNGEGLLDSRDVIDFFNAWASGNHGADFNGDGRLDSDDVTVFLNAWVIGC